jgi:glycine/D-amino acid oxidase-like deaminating enzyme
VKGETALTAPVPAGRPSWWFEDAIAKDRGGRKMVLPLTGRQQADVVIVGGGFCGLWTAIGIKERRPAARVILLEAFRCGAGASGKNGGKVSGYWGSLTSLTAQLGADAALAIARIGTRAQDALRNYCTEPGRDVWWREGGNLSASAAPAQDAAIGRAISTAARLGVPDTAQRFSAAEVQALCRSPVFREGIFYPEGATVHPARLVFALRDSALALGVEIHESTPVVSLTKGSPSLVRTPTAEIVAADVVLATNAALSAEPALAPYLTLFSSYALMTASSPASLDRQGWNSDVGLTDLRMFLHYFRKTPDARVLMGSGSGPIAPTGHAHDPRLQTDAPSMARAARGLRRLLPALEMVDVEATWGGAIDVSSDRLPFFGTFDGTRVHYGCGFSGHGVNATYIAGQCLASLACREQNDWTASAFCTRVRPRLPPEPWRTIGGRAIRSGILACEEAAETGAPEPRIARTLASLPKKFGMRIGTR